MRDGTRWAAIEERFRGSAGTVQLTLKSAYKYLHTEPIERSTIPLSFESTSQWWLRCARSTA